MKHTCFSRQQPSTRRSGAGFTLLEMLVAVAILSILLGVGVPSFQRMIDGWRLSVTSAQMQSHLNLARSEAMKRNARVVVCKSVDGERCVASGGWEQGWMVFHDANNSGTREASESIVAKHISVAAGIRVTGNATVARYVSYSGLGTSLLINGGFQAGTITLCAASSRATEGTHLIINSAGRVRQRKSELPQCA